MDKIFIAGSFGRREELLQHSKTLEAMGYNIICRWLHYADYQAGGPPQASIDDLEDVEKADVIIVQLEQSGSQYFSGGRWVEMGAGLALGKRIIIVGHSNKENVHCHNPFVEHFETWDDLRLQLFAESIKSRLRYK